MKRIVLIFGLIAGGMMSLMLAVTMAFVTRMKPSYSELLGYTTMVLAFLMVYFGIRSYRDTVAAGVISYSRGFAVGSSISLIACACYVATWEVAYRKFAPDFYEQYSATIIDHARVEGATPAELEAKKVNTGRYMEMYKNPLLNIAFTFLEPLPIGLFVTLASAGSLRRRRRVSSARPAIQRVPRRKHGRSPPFGWLQ